MRFIPARNHGPATNKPIVRIVEHGTVSPCEAGEALNVALMFAHTTRDASAHYVTDPIQTIQCVPDNVVAYGAPPNTGSIHRELCDPQPAHPTPAQKARWRDANHQAMLRLAAAEDARLAKLYGIPVRHPSVADLRRNMKGFYSHLDVSLAWRQTDHVDPGPDFPWTQYLAMVKAAQKDPVPPAGDDMPDIIGGYTHTVQQVVANTWKVLEVGMLSDRPTPSMVAGPRRVNGNLIVYLDKPVEGPVTLNAYLAKIVNGSYVAYDSAGVINPVGETRLILPISRTVPAGSLLRCRILTTQDAVVPYVRFDYSTWKV